MLRQATRAAQAGAYQVQTALHSWPLFGWGACRLPGRHLVSEPIQPVVGQQMVGRKASPWDDHVSQVLWAFDSGEQSVEAVSN